MSKNNKKLLKRLTLIVEGGVIVKVFYPVFPTHKNVDEVLTFFKNLECRNLLSTQNAQNVLTHYQNSDILN